jgi:hypothetical protein
MVGRATGLVMENGLMPAGIRRDHGGSSEARLIDSDGTVARSLWVGIPSYPMRRTAMSVSAAAEGACRGLAGLSRKIYSGRRRPLWAPRSKPGYKLVRR